MKKTDDKKKVAIYIRVSSDEQKKEGLSLDAQKRRLEEYALSNDWWIYKIYIDAGVTAKIPIKNRPQGKHLFQDFQKGKFSAILIIKLDRAFRNTVDAILTSDELRESKVDLISLSEQIDTTTAMGKFFFTLMSALAQLERELTGERVHDINLDKFKRGIMIGKAPIGYKWSKTKKQMVIDSRKVGIIQSVFKLASQGKNWQHICEANKISHQTYYNILRNRTYIGFINYRDQEIKGIHEPIVSEELFNKANKNVDDKK